MKMWNLILALCLVFGSAEMGCADSQLPVNAQLSGVPPVADGGWAGVFQGDQMMKRFLDYMDKYHMGAIAAILCTVWAVGKIQKENPDFFNGIVRSLEWPFFVTQRKFQKFFCNGKSLTWNELASWHNRVYKLLSPLTKATSVLDLSKDRRLRAMDAEDDQTQVDEAWIKQVVHIERELGFLMQVLQERLRYYEDQKVKDKKKKSDGIIKSAGKSLMRTSLNRNEEIAFGLKELEGYLTEIVDYCRFIHQSSALNKEHLKKLIGSVCAVFEHLGTLVDEVSAADRTKKKIVMVSDATTRGYSGIDGSGGYGGGYGALGYGGGS